MLTSYLLLQALSGSRKQTRRSGRAPLTIEALNIDRRQHLEQAWRRQEVVSFPQYYELRETDCHDSHLALSRGFTEAGCTVQAEQAMMDLESSSCCSINCVTDLKNLAHLDRVADSAASSVVVVAFYSRVGSLFLLATIACLSTCPSLVIRQQCQLSKSVGRRSGGDVRPMQSCGICKEMLKHYAKLCKEVQTATQACDGKAAHSMAFPCGTCAAEQPSAPVC